ncbi:MAG: redoxin domain-containing protein [Actinobacteria bacterium]|nr:MAG: redoxin domain-containing protein [Actinomycetota bacterium]
MLLLLGVAFVAGVITAISPCVLPVLPILLAGGAASANRLRPYAIVIGLVVSFTTFTLAGAALLSALGLPEDLLRDIAIAALLVLAATLVWPRLAWLLERPFLFLTRRRPSADSNGLLLGVSLGLVFVPCAGPVLAAVTALAATGTVGTRVILVTGAYALGAGLPMLAIAIGGQRLTSGLRILRTHALTTRRIAGIVVGATAVAIAFGADTRFTTALPGYTQALQNRVELSSSARTAIRDLRGGGEALAASGAASRAPEAPAFRGIDSWLNTPDGKPVSIAGYRGKVVLVDFWTYSCINCLRTLPHLEAWDRAYRRAGLRIVGIHTPEFAFEHVPSNVRSAVERLGVRYPVGLDDDYGTWDAYRNEYWPADYLIDRAGRLRFTHFGEGAYGETESQIRRLLGEKAVLPRTSVADTTPTEVTTPESYLGYARLANFDEFVTYDKPALYHFPKRTLSRDELAYAGRWTVHPSRIVAGDDARLRLRFQARDIFLVLGGRGRLSVLVDGRMLRTIEVAGPPRLYTLARFPRLDTGLLELRFTPRLEGYAFTFG